ncbi:MULTISPECIES: M56 family metallopeptidase [unclassified Lysinibacillus]|uniref:M56 family metallopeptidase n=1 Tax=unclassified Lysinibacillus TaxID=2636778 RepID=UPI003822EF5F
MMSHLLVNLYQQLFIMSFVTGIFFLIFKLLNAKAFTLFSARWHYYTSIFIYSFLFIPYHKLGLVFSYKFNQENTSELPFIPSHTLFDTLNLVRLLYEVKQFIIVYFSFLPYLFLLGTFIFITFFFVQNIKFNTYISHICNLEKDLDTMKVLERCKKEMQITTKISLYVSPYTSTPFLYGIFKPKIILPNIEFTTEELQYIFYHELCHWKRHDTWLKYLILFINAIHWFNPLVYYFRNDIDRFCELSCDESVTKSMNNDERRRYGRLLLKVLWSVADKKSNVYAAFSNNSNVKQLERRLDLIMANEKKRFSLFFITTILTLAIAMMVSFTVHATINKTEINSVSKIVHEPVDGEQSISAPSTLKGDPIPESKALNEVPKVVEGEKSMSVSTGF